MDLKSVIIIGSVAAIGLTFVPFTLPSTAQVQRSAVIETAPEKLYQLIASNEGYQQFNPYKSADPALKIKLHGPAFGVGSGFDFDGKDGKGTQVVAALEENRMVKMNIDLGPMGKPTQTFALAPEANGTRVTWTMNMDFGWNPIGRVMGLFMDGMIGKTFEQGLSNMSALAKTA